MGLIYTVKEKQIDIDIYNDYMFLQIVSDH